MSMETLKRSLICMFFLHRSSTLYSFQIFYAAKIRSQKSTSSNLIPGQDAPCSAAVYPLTGADGGFCDRGGLELWYTAAGAYDSGNLGAIAPIRTAKGALF